MPTAAAPPWSARAEGIALSVRLTPKSSREAIDGVELLSDGRAVLKARVRAVPEDGKANDALLRLIAKTLGAPASQASITGGATARLKTVAIKGDAAALAARLSALFPMPA